MSIDEPPVVESDTLPEYDESFWPVFVVRMPPSRLSASAFQRHLSRCSGLHDRGVRFCMLIDMGKHPSMPPVQRKLVAAALKADFQRRPGTMVACGIVVQSAFERGVVTAINWIAQPPCPFKTFATAGEALVWLKQMHAKSADGH